MTSFWAENKIGIMITVALLVVGTAYYISAGLGKGMEGAAVPEEAVDVLREARIKVAVADGMALKLFALAPNSALAKLPSEGQSMPEEDAMVIGSAEAQMMIDEGLFTAVGDRLTDLFGIDTSVGGVLESTGTAIDDMHFLSGEQYRQLEGEEGKVFVKIAPDGLPKLFYTLGEEEEMPVPLTFAQGSQDYYESHDLAGVKYYPVIIGSAEAQMMIEEGLFEKPGDLINGFFGTNVVIAGVLTPTNTSLDMMHIIPAAESELG